MVYCASTATLAASRTQPVRYVATTTSTGFQDKEDIVLRHGAASCKIKALETKTQTKPQKPLQTKTSHSHQQKGDRFMHKHPSLHKGPACNQEGEKATLKAKYKPKLPRCKDKIHTHDAHRPHIGAEPEPPTPPLCKSVPKGHQRGLQKIQEEPIFKVTTTCQPQVGNR